MPTSAPASCGAGLAQCWDAWRERTNTVWRLGMSFNSLRALRSSPTCRLSGIRLVTRTQHGMLYSSSNSISFGESRHHRPTVFVISSGGPEPLSKEVFQDRLHDP